MKQRHIKRIRAGQKLINALNAGRRTQEHSTLSATILTTSPFLKHLSLLPYHPIAASLVITDQTYSQNLHHFFQFGYMKVGTFDKKILGQQSGAS
jgi:hypothetical protein